MPTFWTIVFINRAYRFSMFWRALICTLSVAFEDTSGINSNFDSEYEQNKGEGWWWCAHARGARLEKHVLRARCFFCHLKGNRFQHFGVLFCSITFTDFNPLGVRSFAPLPLPSK